MRAAKQQERPDSRSAAFAVAPGVSQVNGSLKNKKERKLVHKPGFQGLGFAVSGHGFNRAASAARFPRL
jgi:hypothetical protein